MSEENADGETSPISRRTALTTAGGLGAGAVAIPGMAAASGDESEPELDPAEIDVDVVDEGAETVVYVDDESIEPPVRPRATTVEIVCVEGYCLEAVVSLSYTEIEVDLVLAGTTLATVTLTPTDVTASVDASAGPASFDADLEADFTSLTVSISADLCVDALITDVCRGGSVTVR